MKFDLGMLALIAAVLIFYLRLIIIQRERTKRLHRLEAAQKLKEPRKPSKKGAAPSNASGGKNTSAATERFSIFSSRRRDWIIAGVGLVLITFALLLYSGVLRLPAVQPYAWIPAALGIVMFSWAFQL